MNWRWNDAAIVLCQEQSTPDYRGHDRRPNIGGWGGDSFTAVLGEIHLAHGDAESAVDLLGSWLLAHQFGGQVELHVDVPPDQATTGTLDALLRRSPLADRTSVVARPRRAPRYEVYKKIDGLLEESMLLFRLVIDPLRAPRLAQELREQFAPGRPRSSDGGSTASSSVFIDALAPCMEHRFFRAVGADRGGTRSRWESSSQ